MILKMEIILELAIYLVIFMPLILCAILAAIIIWIIRTRLLSDLVKTLIIIGIFLCICIIGTNIKEEKPNDLYREMKEISEGQTLIGISTEAIKLMFGEPIEKYDSGEHKEVYRYNAGHIGKGIYLGDTCIFFDCYEDYVLNVKFDENNIVKSTSIQRVP